MMVLWTELWRMQSKGSANYERPAFRRMVTMKSSQYSEWDNNKNPKRT
jgi:hypothetical protein